MKKTTAQIIRAESEQTGGGRRGKIEVISKASIKNAVEVLTNAEPELNSMIVATYPDTFPDDGRIVKCHHKRLLQWLDRRLGQDYSYFTAFEYQKRGAPHFHIGLSLNLAEFGAVSQLKRKKAGRRFPLFSTVKPLQDELFEAWLEIISHPDPVYGGEVLEWAGIDEDDQCQMRKAYTQYNAGFSWEVMREMDGAKKYFVKELTGLKLYQKTIPEGYKNPGRHFLYSYDMRFDPDEAIIFQANERELRELLNIAGWKFIPDVGKPLFKNLWNAAASLGIALVEHGFEPIADATKKALRRFSDFRALSLSDPDDLWQIANEWAEVSREISSAHYWKYLKRKLTYQITNLNQIFRTGPPTPEVSVTQLSFAL